MELNRKETRAPLHIFMIGFALYLLQVCAATYGETYEISNVASRTRPSVQNSPPPAAMSLTRNVSSLTHEPFSFRWRRRRNRRSKTMRENMEFLAAHNVIRARLGEPPLSWDRGLAAEARAFAKKNVDACILIHVNPDGTGPGENAFWGGLDHWTPTEIVQVWADEDQFYDMESNTCEAGKACGHYTQIVWKNTSKVGCSRVNCTKAGVYALCLYDPPGNFEGEGPFGVIKVSPDTETD